MQDFNCFELSKDSSILETIRFCSAIGGSEQGWLQFLICSQLKLLLLMILNLICR